jgi:O-succinylbenzoate synthase
MNRPQRIARKKAASRRLRRLKIRRGLAMLDLKDKEDAAATAVNQCQDIKPESLKKAQEAQLSYIKAWVKLRKLEREYSHASR